MEITHRHHIVPRHVGGSDDSSNLVELTVLDHAIAHKVLYGLWGRWQDKIAWECLSGQMDVAQAIVEAGRLANLGKKASIETRKLLSKVQKEGYRRNPTKAARHSKWMTQNNPSKTDGWKRSFQETWNNKSPEERKAFSERCSHATKGIKKTKTDKMGRYERTSWVCPNCGKTGKGETNRTRWHFDNCRKVG